MIHRPLLAAFMLSTALVAPAHAQDRGAKNVILMISDGIGFNGWLAGDYYQGLAGTQSYQVARPDGTVPLLLGQSHWALNLVDEAGRILEEEDLDRAAGVVEQQYDPILRWNQFERTFRNDFPPVSIPYASYTDSSSAATALYTGKKTINARINKDWTGEIDYKTIAEIAREQGRSAGAVSTVQASHATPATVFAHNASRNAYAEIFNEMMESGAVVVMGGGHPLFDISGRPVDPAAPGEAEEGLTPEEIAAAEAERIEALYRFVGGVDTWEALTSEEGLNGFAFIETREQFEALAEGAALPEKVVGIFQSHLTTQADREGMEPDPANPSGDAFIETVPSLATMTVGALNVLNQNPDGFFLMAEGGAVDWMGHANNMPRYIEEQVDFNKAVDAAIDWVEANSSWDETLLIITADHETGGIWGEGTFINGTGGPVAETMDEADVKAARFDPSEDRFEDFLAVQDRGAGNIPGFQFASGNHTNELVPLWALGAGSERFLPFARVDSKAARLWGHGAPYDWDGSYVDNTTVFHVMNGAFAADRAQRGLSQ